MSERYLCMIAAALEKRVFEQVVTAGKRKRLVRFVLRKQDAERNRYVTGDSRDFRRKNLWGK